MNLEKICRSKIKIPLIGLLALCMFMILLPHAVKSINFHYSPLSDQPIAIETVSYQSTDRTDGSQYQVVGNLFIPGPKFSNDTFPGIVACHGYLFGLGKEQMNRWCVELARRGFVCLSIDLPANGMTLGKNDMTPNADIKPYVIEDGLTYLKSLECVDDTKMGLIGISYGGGMVAISSGVLGNKVQATVCMNGFTNLTHVLIKGTLPGMNIDFDVTDDEIILNSAGGQPITEKTIRDILTLYSFIYGDPENIEYVFSQDKPNVINRSVLRKFDAVEYLHDSTSIMFIHSRYDTTFSNTNQSWLGYQVASNGIYILVNDTHQLFDDPTHASDYAYINYFEEQLKGVDLGSGFSSDIEKYIQHRNITLSYVGVFGFPLAYEALGVFFLSLIPFVAIVNLIFYDKQISEKRLIKLKQAKEIEEAGGEKHGIPFSMGSYRNTIIYIILLFAVCYIAVSGLAVGFFTSLIAAFFIMLFYPLLNLLFYFIPDKKEVEFWIEEQGEKKDEKIQSNAVNEVNLRESLKKVGLIVLFIIIASIVISIFSVSPTVSNQSAESLITPMLIMGIALILGSLYFIYFFEKRENDKIKFNTIQWEEYKLSKYQLIKGAAFGTIMATGLIFTYGIMAHYLKFPMMLGPHSVYYLYVAIAVVVFTIGLEIVNEGILNKYILDKSSRNNEIKSKIIVIGLGALINFVVGILLFYPLLGFNSIGRFAFYVGLAFAAIYLITRLINLIFFMRGILSSAIFYPLFFLSILGFFMRI